MVDCDTAVSEFTPLTCAYAYNSQSERAIVDFLNVILNGTTTTDEFQRLLSGPPALRALYHGGNNSLEETTARIRNMTNAMTLFIRADGDPSNSALATGMVREMTICVAIQWPWFMLPVAIAALSIGVLGATFYSVLTKGRHMNWKDSTLPLLFHGLEPNLRERFCDVGQLEDMRELAHKTNVQLTQTQDGWRLVEVCDGMRTRKKE